MEWPADEWVATPNFWIPKRWGHEIGTIVWHSTRGGRRSKVPPFRKLRHGIGVEYSATKSWTASKKSKVFIHSLIGPQGRCCRFHPNIVPATIKASHRYAGWHVGIGPVGVALTSLAMEIVQEWPEDAYDGLVVQRAIEESADWARLYDIPPVLITPQDQPRNLAIGKDLTVRGFLLHGKIRRGKSDPGIQLPTEEMILDIKNMLRVKHPGGAPHYHTLDKIPSLRTGGPLVA